MKPGYHLAYLAVILTLGFKLTWKGFKHMQEYIDKRPELKRHMHMLVHAGDEVRQQAPGWALKEYQASAR